MNLDTFRTPRLFAERLTAAHLDEIRRMHLDATVMHYLGGVRTEEQTQEYLRKNLEHWERYGFGLYIVHTAARDAVVGRAVVRHLDLDGTPEVEIGYALYPEWWGQGLATEIANKCLDIGRSQLGFESLVAVTQAENRASRHVLEKCGMEYERDRNEWVIYRTKRRT
ncbi:MAG: GNAT family N-acetyltransferase [Gemmatimonadota bacterium]|nr:GNAT family N-acetyltransferase [Gemmatimonadota bacterium]